MKLLSKRISDLGRVVTGKTPPTDRDELFGGPYPFITPSDIDDETYYCRSTARTASEEARSLLANQFVPRDAVMVTCIGTIGKVALAPTDCLTNQQINSIVASETTDPKFLYYFMRSHGENVKQIGGGAATPIVSKKKFESIVVRVPDFSYQQAIGQVLSSYDEFRENSRRRMVVLEQAARQLYREWFVRLRFPGREHTRVVDGVPGGWERRELDGCATFLSGGTPSKAREDFWEGDIPWASSGELTELRIADTPLKITAEAADVGSRLVPRETILAVVRGMSLAKEWRISLTSREMAFNQDLKAIVANEDVDPLYLFHALDAQRDQVRDRAGEASHGTKKLETAVLSALPILVPPHPIQMLFREHVEPMHALWDNLHRQNQKLRAARDLLLPRLMSGELVV